MTCYSLHAEMNALFKCIKSTKVCKKFHVPLDLSLSCIYVARLNSMKINGEPVLGNSKPCKCCLPILTEYKVKKIKYTDVVNGVNVLCEMKLV